MKYSIECKYCGHKWSADVYAPKEYYSCPRCNDKQLIFSEYDEKNNIFGYDKKDSFKDAYIKKNNHE